MAIYPGATFKPTTWGGKVPRNRQGRGILHVAVSLRTSYPPNSGNTWHFYIAQTAPDGSTDGSGGPAYCEQYVDTDFRAYASADANDDALSAETAGGLGTSKELNKEPWTRAQELRIADIMRWDSRQPGGAPLELLPDSKPGRRGWGPHRLGIKHSAGPRPGWWQPGGEVWSSALGKECPGDAKVAQIPGIIELARNGPEEDMPLTNEDVDLIWRKPALEGYGVPILILRGLSQQVAGLNAALSSLASAVASGRDDLTADELSAAVQDGIRRAGEELRAVEEAAKKTA